MAATFNNVKVKKDIYILKVNIKRSKCVLSKNENLNWLCKHLQPNKNMKYDNEKFLLVNNSALLVIQVLSIDF